MCGGGGLCDDKGQLIWVRLSRWETFPPSAWLGKAIAFHMAWGRDITTGTLRQEGGEYPFSLCRRKCGQRGGTIGNSRTRHWWLEPGRRQLKAALVSRLWKIQMAVSCPVSKRIEKYCLTESLGLTLHPHNLGRVLHLWFPTSVLSLFRVKKYN